MLKFSLRGLLYLGANLNKTSGDGLSTAISRRSKIKNKLNKRYIEVDANEIISKKSLM